MKRQNRAVILVSLALISVLAWFGCARRAAPPATPLAPEVFKPLQDALQKSYLELFRLAPTLEFSETQIQNMRSYLRQAKDYCVGEYKGKAKQYETRLSQLEGNLKKVSGSASDAQRHDLHCDIQNTRALKSQTEVLANHGIPVAYENRDAKLDVIEKWPAQLKQAQQDIANGSYQRRRWGDVKDIGFRQIEPNQKDDIKTGEEAIRQMRQAGLVPKEIENKAVSDYVNTVAQDVAKHSDLQIPLHVTVLNSKEINAFALPGGYLFIERGLLEAAEDESQLAGVIAHEIAHDVARHGHKLMVKATIASIVYQAAQVAAVVLTGGAAGIGTLYALQYGFYGLGLALNLELLGVSREFELQADQLGIQYTWNSGYDSTGFIRFFDKMATKEGYVNGISWFRSHPPFYQRMVDAEREIMFLPKKENLAVQTSAFEQMKKELKSVTAAAEENEKNKPSLLAPEQGCPAPPKIEYEPGKDINTICSPPNQRSQRQTERAKLSAP